VQKWDTKDITSVKTEKSKHVHIEVGGSKAASLHYHATPKEVEAIVDKVESSRALSSSSSPPKASSPEPESTATTPSAATRRTLPPPLAIPTQPPESKKGVHFRGSPASIIPSPPDRDDGSEIGEEEEEGEGAAALYDFAADGEDELTVRSGERLRVIDRTNDEWWKCRNSYGAEGVVPASYVDVSVLTDFISSHLTVPQLENPIKGNAAQRKSNDDDEEEERGRLQAEQEEEERKAKEARERKAREEADRKAKAAAVAVAAERKKKDEERRKREQEEEEERERQEQEDREREQAAKRAAQTKRQSEERYVSPSLHAVWH